MNFHALQEGRPLNKSYIQSKVDVGRYFIEPDIREYIENI